MQVTQVIILAGGLGTRLKSVVSDLPKPMAKIKNRPFLEWKLNYLKNQGVNKVILSVGYKYECIIDYFGSEYNYIDIEYAIETAQLGTGGGIKNALQYIDNNNVWVMNGDTFFNADLQTVENIHFQRESDVTLVLKKMENCGRYGYVNMEDYKIISFQEKQKNVISGLINGGVYLIKTNIFSEMLDVSFSFEEYLAKNTAGLNIIGIEQEGEFIDIGIPDDYYTACELIPRLVNSNNEI